MTSEVPDAPDPFSGPSWLGESEHRVAGSSPGRERRRRPSRRRLRRRRRLGIAMIVVGAAIVLTGVWVLVTAFLARGQIMTVRDEVHQLRAQISAGDLDGARATARQITGHADKAHSYTSGPAWAAVAGLPGGGAPFQTVRTMTAELDTVGQRVLPEVVSASHALDPATLRRPDGSIDLGRISAVAPSLNAADTAMTGATAKVAARPTSSWIGPVDKARDQLLTQLRSLGHTLHSADLAARIVPQMLGQSGVKRYFIAFQNDAEARGTGGLPGAFAIVRADHGKLSFERFEPDTTLGKTTSGLNLGRDYNHLWSPSLATEQYVDSNVSPHYPYAGRIWIAMWHKYSHERLDGALAVDPTALSYLLAVTGPVALPDGTVIKAGNVVQLTQQTLYTRFYKKSQVPARKQFLLDVARSVSRKILSSKASTTSLVKAAGQAGAQRRLLIYSTDPSVEKSLEQTSLSGAVPRTKKPFVQLVINNAGGNKLDYYLQRGLTWTRSGCGSRRDVTVRITLTNHAPTGLSAFAAARNDHPPYPTKRGDNRLDVYYYATDGTFLRSATLDGKIAQLVYGKEQGHPVFGADVEMPRGKTRTLVLKFLEPAGATGAPLVEQQPLVRPLHEKIDPGHCG